MRDVPASVNKVRVLDVVCEACVAFSGASTPVLAPTVRAWTVFACACTGTPRLPTPRADASLCVQGDWPKKPVVSSYDVVEKGGFVWLFYGSRGVPEDVRPPIPMMPEVRRY